MFSACPPCQVQIEAHPAGLSPSSRLNPLPSQSLQPSQTGLVTLPSTQSLPARPWALAALSRLLSAPCPWALAALSPLLSAPFLSISSCSVFKTQPRCHLFWEVSPGPSQPDAPSLTPQLRFISARVSWVPHIMAFGTFPTCNSLSYHD